MSSTGGRQAAPFLAAMWTRCRQHLARWISGCFSFIKEKTPLWIPVMTLALSQPKAMQFCQGMPRTENSLLMTSKMFCPVKKKRLQLLITHKSVSWCFEPSQPQWITSGLNRNSISQCALYTSHLTPTSIFLQHSYFTRTHTHKSHIYFYGTTTFL